MTKCVTIRGTAIGWRIYADVDALYRPISDWQKDSSNGGTLGLSGDPNDESQWPKDGELELTGTMQDCEAAHEMMVEVPLRRFARPAEIAAAVLFLASDESRYITGLPMTVDAGSMLK